MNKKFKQKNIYMNILIIFLSILSIFIRYPQVNTYNYYNSDATSHTLLTAKSYSETPIEIHKFVPINTLGNISNKFINNGPSLAMDKYGNNYYVTFSAAGFIIPYLFIKIFNLPYIEQSLYFLNSIIYILCMFSCIKLFKNIFKNKIEENKITILVAALYLFQFETMHSQGIVFWAQSIFQLLLIWQIYFFINRDKKIYKILFLICCWIMPYIEWTGYISNAGFFIATFFDTQIKNKKEIYTKLKQALTIASLTLLGGGELYNSFFISIR